MSDIGEEFKRADANVEPSREKSHCAHFRSSHDQRQRCTAQPVRQATDCESFLFIYNISRLMN